jgi:hypothetical protein
MKTFLIPGAYLLDVSPAFCFSKVSLLHLQSSTAWRRTVGADSTAASAIALAQ